VRCGRIARLRISLEIGWEEPYSFVFAVIRHHIDSLTSAASIQRRTCKRALRRSRTAITLGTAYLSYLAEYSFVVRFTPPVSPSIDF
jgi:hypothetical protein